MQRMSVIAGLRAPELRLRICIYETELLEEAWTRRSDISSSQPSRTTACDALDDGVVYSIRVDL